MKIIQTPVRIGSTGGVEEYVHNLSKGLSSRGHQVTVVGAAAGESAFKDAGYHRKLLRSWFKLANTNITPALLFTLLSSDFDLIHTHIPTPWTAEISALVSRIRKKPLILTYHNDIRGEGIYAPVAWIYNRFILPLVLKQASRIIITRTHHQSPCLKPFSAKLVCIPPGVDSTLFFPGETPGKIGDLFFLGIFDEYHQYKGFDVLLQALSLLAHQGKEVRLIAGGSGPLIARYRELAADLSIDRNVTFPGFIPGGDLQSFYAGTSAFVLPSTDPSREGFGIVLLEAMACGRPVIATNIAGMAAEIEECGAGIIVKRNNPSELADAIRLIIDEKPLAGRMGDAGRRLIEERFDWKIIAERVETLYDGVL
ncbi:MAG TPA: glycosyltransferase family 4 protein [Methanoregulaceae archaeon]|nr:glycosyltransferase family 4 protein [Methanoregulaceae archaeon]